MDTAIINLPAVTDQICLPSTLRAALDSAADLASNSRAASTRAACASDWRIFARWCETHGGTVPAHQARQSHHRPPARCADHMQARKDQAAKLGLDPKQYGAHSMRAGFLTSAAAKGANLFKMMDVSRHKSVDTLKGYVRSADAFRDHAGAGLL
jgi:hypothetical protein